jgi:hypothetical protein
MNRGALRTELRARLQEETEDQWSDADLNAKLNLSGLQKLQLYILSVDPEAFVSTYRTNVVNASSDPELLRIYPWPDGTLYELEVAYKGASDTRYRVLERVDYRSAKRNESLYQGGTTLKWARHGSKHFVLTPPPTEAITNGLQVKVVEALTMADDSDVPDVPLVLHDAIVLFAQIACLAETGEPSNAVKEDLAALLKQIPNYYQRSGSGPAVFQPQVSKLY